LTVLFQSRNPFFQGRMTHKQFHPAPTAIDAEGRQFTR
jgi:hypothetical protein